MLKVVELIDRKKPSMIKVANANGFPAVFTEQPEIDQRSQGIKYLGSDKVSDGIV